MFLTVYLSNNEQHFTEVPVTPETICRDVVDLCKEPGESECHLAEVWCGSGRSPYGPFITVGFGRGQGRCSRLYAEKLWSSVSARRQCSRPSFVVTWNSCPFLSLLYSEDTAAEWSEDGQLIYQLGAPVWGS